MSEQRRKEELPPRGWTPLVVAATLSVTWLVAAVYLGYWAAPSCPSPSLLTFRCLKANEWADFFAGVFAPIAFIWLVATVWIQSSELREQRRELILTRREFEDNRDVMKAQATEAQKQAEFIGLQTKIVQNEYIASHPPSITVIRVFVDVDAWLTGAPAGKVYIANVGQNLAVLKNDGGEGLQPFGNIVFHIGQYAPAYDPFDQASNPIITENIEQGQSGFWNVVDFPVIDARELAKAASPGSATNLFIIGRIHYLDQLGGRRETIFCRKYCGKEKRWVQSNFPEFEYQT